MCGHFFKNPKQTSVHIHAPWTLYNMADNGSFFFVKIIRMVFSFIIFHLIQIAAVVSLHLFVSIHYLINLESIILLF